MINIRLEYVTCLLCFVTAIAEIDLSGLCNGTGTCLSVQNCPYGLEILKLRDIDRIRNITCGFEGNWPLVCCPNATEHDKIQFESNLKDPTLTPSNTTFTSTEAKWHRPTENIEITTYRTSTAESNLSGGRQSSPNVPNAGSQIIGGNVQDFVAPTTDTKYSSDINISNEAPVDSRVPITQSDQLLPDTTVCGIMSQSPILDRIVGGDITYLTEFPWVVRLKYRIIKSNGTIVERYDCGGTLISDRYVVTAAHCILFSDKSRQLIEVRLGEWDEQSVLDCDMGVCNDPPVDVAIEEAIVYPTYNRSSIVISGDIALLRLERPVNFTESIRPICLPNKYHASSLDTNPNNAYWAAGWGKTEYQLPSTIKKKVKLNIVPLEICRITYPRQINNDLLRNILCAGGRKNEDTCTGDSGGPLMATASKETTNWYLYGVISFGARLCGKEGTPSGFSRVTFYVNWIMENLR